MAVLRVQSVLAATAVVLIADAARRLTRPWVALTLGAALSLYEMSILFDELILSESLIFFLESLLLWLWCTTVHRRPGIAWLIATGVLIGIIAQGRPIGALLLIPALTLAGSIRHQLVPRLHAHVGLICIPFLLTMLPTVLWHWSLSREFIPFTYSGGYNLYIGNNPAATGGFVWVAGGDRYVDLRASRSDGGGDGDGREFLQRKFGLRLSPGQSSDYWMGEAFTFVRHNPTAAFVLVGKKLLLLLNNGELSQIEIRDEYNRLAGPIGLPIIGTFACVGTLGLIGFAIARTSPYLDRALRLYVLVVILGTLPFFVTDRYRLHLLPALALLAAGAVETAIVARDTQSPHGIRRIGLAVVGAAAIVALPIAQTPRTLEELRIARDLGMRSAEQGRPDQAIVQFERAVRLEQMLPTRVSEDSWSLPDRALLHFNYGVALHRFGRENDALTWLRTAAKEKPDDARFLRTLADAYFANARAQEGDSLLRRVSLLEGGEAQLLLSEGWRAARSGQLEDAERLFGGAVRNDPHLYGAWGALIRVQVERGALRRADSTLASAARIGMPRVALLAHRALVDAASGRDEAAREALQNIPEAALAGDPMAATVAAKARLILTRRGP